MSTHRTPPGSTPRRGGTTGGKPPAGTRPAGAPTRGRGQGADATHDRTAPRAARAGQGASRSADAPVVTGRTKAGSDRPRTGPDKKSRTRLQGAPEGQADRAATPSRRDDRQDDRASRPPQGDARVPVRQPSRGADARGEQPARTPRVGRAPQQAVQAPARPEPRPRRGEDDAAPRGDAPARRETVPHAAEADESGARGAPAKGMWLYGSHAVAAALANPDRHLRRLLLTVEAEAAMRERHAGAWPLQPERIDRSRLDQLLGRDAVHGGAALLADPLSPPSLAEVLARPGPVLVLDQVSDPRNVGAILRSAASFGACAVVVQDRNAPEETGVMAKAASGAMERVPLLRAVNLARTLGALKAAGLWVVGLDASGGHLSGAALSERRVALVLGAEGAGLRRLTRETCDELSGLPMPGGMESLNVSAAAAVALYELTRLPPPAP